MKLLDRYIGSEFIKAFSLALIGLVSIFLFIDLLEKLRIETDQPRSVFLLYILYSTPQIMAWMIPAALILGVSFTVAQFTVNREMVAIYSGGISFYRTSVTILLFGAFLSIFLFLFQNFIVTPSNEKARETLSLIQKDSAVAKDIIWQKNFRGSRGFYFVYYLDREKERVIGGFHYIELDSRDRPVMMIQAKEAGYDKKKSMWVLKDAESMSFNKDLRVESLKKYEKLETALPEDISFFAHPSRDPSELNVFELREEIDARKKRGLPASLYELEWHMNFAFPLMTFILALVGAIAGASGNLRSTGPLIRSLLISIVTYFVYYLTFRLGVSLGNSGVLSPVVAAWGPTVFYFFAAGFLVYRFRK